MDFETAVDYLSTKYAILMKDSLHRLSTDPEYLIFCRSWYNQTVAFTEKCFPQYNETDSLDSFARVCIDHLRGQNHLLTKGYYTDLSYDEINEKVYQSEETMMGYYLPGLRLTTAFWYNHYQLWLYFTNWLKSWSNSESLLEVGVGHGSFLHKALQTHNVTAKGYDISQYSIEWTRRLLVFDGIDASRYQLICEAYNMSGQHFDHIICGELLEHIPDPKSLLRDFRGSLTQNGELFLTTVINAAAVDHLYLFKHVQEIRDMIDESGLRIKTEMILPIKDVSIEDAETSKIPVNYGTILCLK